MIGGLAFKGAPLLNRIQYKRRLFLLWIYSIVWIVSGMVIFAIFRNSINVYLKICAGVFFAVFSPTFPDLFIGYESYAEDWKRKSQRESHSG